MTPSHWVGETHYHDVIQLTTSKDKYPLLIDGNKSDMLKMFNRVNNGKPFITVNTFDNRTMCINTSFIIHAEPLTIAEQCLHSDNNNFPTGDYVCRYLLHEGQTLTFSTKP